MGEMIGAIILGLIALTCFVISFFQFRKKGFLFNNAYIYASKIERETMDKAPHYKQSGIVFLLIGVIFALNAVDLVLKTNWVIYLVIGTIITAIVYAIASSRTIEKNK